LAQAPQSSSAASVGATIRQCIVQYNVCTTIRRSEVVRHDSGLVFRFLYDRSDPSQLHIVRRWGVTPEQAIATHFEAPEAGTVWLGGKRCYETVNATHVLVWLWDQPNVQLLVVTCVPLEQSLRRIS
jgi:hypothetical protein